MRILGNRLLVEEEIISDNTAAPGEIILRPGHPARDLNTPSFWASVILIGNGKDIPPEIAVGQRVFCARMGGQRRMFDGRMCRLISSLDVLAIQTTNPKDE